MSKTVRGRGSVRVGRLFGIDIRVHWTFLLLIPLVALTSSDRSQFLMGLVWIAAVFGSVLVHEFSHCFVARHRGAVVEDILLLPIGGLSEMQQIPRAPSDEAAIAVVGPLTSIALGLAFAAAGALAAAQLWPPTLFAGSWLSRLAWLNLLLGGFNLLPALPMDGGRVLRALLARNHDRRSATRIAARVARVVAVAMAVTGLLYDLWLVVIAIFVWLGANSEENAANSSSGDDDLSSGKSHSGARQEGPGQRQGDQDDLL
jgi:Zn-dependent protease